MCIRDRFWPDLVKASENEKRQWIGFHLDETELSDAADPRFDKWVRRYIDGSWDVDNGPIAQLDAVIRQINAITTCAVDRPLFTATDIRGLCFPSVENNHRYHDAHSEAYKLLQDALSREAIDRLAAKLGISVKSGDQWTTKALKQLLPESLHSGIFDPLEVVSQQRRIADHKERPAPVPFPAFETFRNNMAEVVRGLENLRDALGQVLNLDVGSCEERASALKHLPTFDESRPAEANYGICNAYRGRGKQIVEVRAGYRSPTAGLHDSEALILEFSDGSMLSIDALTNIRQLIEPDHPPLTPESLHVTFDVTYIPPLQPYRAPLGSIANPDPGSTENPPSNLAVRKPG